VVFCLLPMASIECENGTMAAGFTLSSSLRGPFSVFNLLIAQEPLTKPRLSCVETPIKDVNGWSR
jgi:hypothetical protein